MTDVQNIYQIQEVCCLILVYLVCIYFFNVSYEFTSKWLSCTLLQLQVHTLLYFVHFYVCHIFFIRLFVDSGISVFYSFLSCYSLLFLFVVLYVLWVLMADSNK